MTVDDATRHAPNTEVYIAILYLLLSVRYCLMYFSENVDNTNNSSGSSNNNHIFKIGKSRRHVDRLTACLLDRLFGGAIAAGESIYVKGVGSFPCCAAHAPSPHLWCVREGCGSGRARVTIVQMQWDWLVTINVHCHSTVRWKSRTLYTRHPAEHSCPAASCMTSMSTGCTWLEPWSSA